MGCHFLLQGIFPTQGLNPRLLHLPALAGRFFTSAATWEALSEQYKKKSHSLRVSWSRGLVEEAGGEAVGVKLSFHGEIHCLSQVHS